MKMDTMTIQFTSEPYALGEIEFAAFLRHIDSRIEGIAIEDNGLILWHIKFPSHLKPRVVDYVRVNLRGIRNFYSSDGDDNFEMVSDPPHKPLFGTLSLNLSQINYVFDKRRQKIDEWATQMMVFGNVSSEISYQWGEIILQIMDYDLILGKWVAEKLLDEIKIGTPVSVIAQVMDKLEAQYKKADAE